MSEKSVKGVNVQIFGDQYPIASEGEETEVQRIAEYVDKKMREIADVHAGRLGTTRVAVLAAMEITVELFRAMKERNQLTEKAHQNLDRLSKLIEDRASMSSGVEQRNSTTLERLLQEQPATQQD